MNQESESRTPISYNAGNSADDPQNARFVVQLCALAYKTQPVIEAELVDLGYTDTKVIFFGTNLTAGFVIEWDEVLVVVFKGSNTFREWLNNLRIGMLATDVGYIHVGFYDSFQNIANSLYPMIASKIEISRHLVICGHSRGGALATLFAAYVRYMGGRVHAVYTFGSPKVGDKQFVDWCEKNLNCPHLRYVRGADIVPLFPPENWSEFFQLLLSVPQGLFVALPRLMLEKIKVRMKRTWL